MYLICGDDMFRQCSASDVEPFSGQREGFPAKKGNLRGPGGPKGNLGGPGGLQAAYCSRKSLTLSCCCSQILLLFCCYCSAAEQSVQPLTLPFSSCARQQWQAPGGVTRLPTLVSHSLPPVGWLGGGRAAQRGPKIGWLGADRPHTHACVLDLLRGAARGRMAPAPAGS